MPELLLSGFYTVRGRLWALLQVHSAMAWPSDGQKFKRARWIAKTLYSLSRDPHRMARLEQRLADMESVVQEQPLEAAIADYLETMGLSDLVVQGLPLEELERERLDRMPTYLRIGHILHTYRSFDLYAPEHASLSKACFVVEGILTVHGLDEVAKPCKTRDPRKPDPNAPPTNLRNLWQNYRFIAHLAAAFFESFIVAAARTPETPARLEALEEETLKRFEYFMARAFEHQEFARGVRFPRRPESECRMFDTEWHWIPQGVLRIGAETYDVEPTQQMLKLANEHSVRKARLGIA